MKVKSIKEGVFYNELLLNLYKYLVNLLMILYLIPKLVFKLRQVLITRTIEYPDFLILLQFPDLLKNLKLEIQIRVHFYLKIFFCKLKLIAKRK